MKTHRKVAWLLALLVSLVLLPACSAPASAPSTEAPPTPSPTEEAAPVKEKVKEKATDTLIIPADVSYEVIDTDIVPGIKRSLDVRLNKKVSEDVLRAIALEVKSNDLRQYDRTFICYYLPDMAVGAGAWATTHFDPTLDVRILGLTAQEEQALVTEPTPSNREVIGSWLSELIGSQITIYREDDTLYIEQKFKDGSSLKEELVEKSSPLSQRFDLKKGSSFGDHWIIDRGGNLQIRDNAGLISTAKRIQ